MSWVEEHPDQFRGLTLCRRMIQLAAANIADEELSDDDIVAISIEIDHILLALKALAESNSMSTLDAELESLLSQGESEE